MAVGKWITLYDDAGTFKETRQVGKGKYQVIEVIDLHEHISEREATENGGRFSGALSFIDLNAVPETELDKACVFCGLEREKGTSDLALVEALQDYGCKAPIGSCSETTEAKCKKAMRQEAKEALENLTERLNKPVNAIGSTASEYMRGDIMSALQRGVEAGEPGARVMAKMYGNAPHVIDDTRPEDWLPYFTGYQDGIAGSPKQESTRVIAPEYFRGYERGQRVKNGECPAPSWIKSQR
jgi:hypothetical protein